MGYNITHSEASRSTLRISRHNAERATKLDLPEGAKEMLRRLAFGEDGFAPLGPFWWYGDGSGNASQDGTLEKFVRLTEGDADVILTWEGGDSYSGLRIRNGTMREAKVILELAPEE